MPFHIISIRGHHSDAAPQNTIIAFLRILRKSFPGIPITVAIESDPMTLISGTPEEQLERLIAEQKRFVESRYYHEVALSNLSERARENSSVVSMVENALREHDRGFYWLYKAIKAHKAGFIFSDLPGINKIPLGDPLAEKFRGARDARMAGELYELSARGGIIIDFGGMNHTSPIQRLLSEKGISVEDISSYICYSKDGAEIFLPPEILRREMFLGMGADAITLYDDSQYTFDTGFVTIGNEAFFGSGATSFNDTELFARDILEKVSPKCKKIMGMTVDVTAARADTVHSGGGAGGNAGARAGGASSGHDAAAREAASVSTGSTGTFSPSFEHALRKKMAEAAKRSCREEGYKSYSVNLPAEMQEELQKANPALEFKLQRGEEAGSSKVIVKFPEALEGELLPKLREKIAEYKRFCAAAEGSTAQRPKVRKV